MQLRAVIMQVSGAAHNKHQLPGCHTRWQPHSLSFTATARELLRAFSHHCADLPVGCGHSCMLACHAPPQLWGSGDAECQGWCICWHCFGVLHCDLPLEILSDCERELLDAEDLSKKAGTVKHCCMVYVTTNYVTLLQTSSAADSNA